MLNVDAYIPSQCAGPVHSVQPTEIPQETGDITLFLVKCEYVMHTRFTHSSCV